MSEQKSKIPDFNEIVGMANKLFSVVKEGVCEIVKDYKEKHATTQNTTEMPKPEVDSATKPVVEKEELKKEKFEEEQK